MEKKDNQPSKPTEGKIGKHQTDSSSNKSNPPLFFDPTILRAYDIRGTFGKTLSVEMAHTLGKQFGAWMRAHNKNSIVIGYDGRLSSPPLRDALISGLTVMGLDVCEIGLGPTPMLYFAVQHLQMDAGIMITGSHNPADDNGFKITLQDRPFFGEDIQSLNLPIELPQDIIGDADNITEDDASHEGHIAIMATYINRLLHGIQFTDTLLRIAIDCGNGATGDLITHLIKRLPSRIHVQLMYEDIDGTFPNHHPDPAVASNLTALIDRVKREKLDLGIAFDGDGDRLGVVDRHGNVITGDQLTLFFAVSILRANSGATIMADVKSSQLVFEAIEASGGQSIMCPTGHSYFKSLMPKHDVLFGGEMSGHYFFKDRYFGFDDGIYAMLRLLELTSQGYDIGHFLTLLPKFFPSKEIKIPCADDKKFEIIAKVKRILAKQNMQFIDIDGIRLSLEGGWWLLRASNTSPYLVARYESYFEPAQHAVCTHLEDMLQEVLPGVAWVEE